MIQSSRSLALTMILCPFAAFAQEVAENAAGTSPEVESTTALTGAAGEETTPSQGKMTTGEPPDRSPAQTTLQPAPAPAASQIPAVAPTPAPLTQRVRFPDKVAVEQAVGETLGDEYYRWTTGGKHRYFTFRDYIYARYKKGRRAGIIYMSVLGTAGIAMMVSSSEFFMYAESCTEDVDYNLTADGEYVREYNERCHTDGDSITGGALLLGAGAGLAIMFFTLGAVKTVKSSRKMRILSKMPAQPGKISFEGIGLSMSAKNLPSGAHLTFTF
jgi:hypothetical protein